MMDRETLTHWHGQPSELGPPPDCCAGEFKALLAAVEREHGRQLAEAVHGERRRVILTAMQVTEMLGGNVAVVLEGREKRLAEVLTKHAADAIRQTGCICPRIDATLLGGPPRTIPGRDPRCGLHDIEEPR